MDQSQLIVGSAGTAPVRPAQGGDRRGQGRTRPAGIPGTALREIVQSQLPGAIHCLLAAAGIGWPGAARPGVAPGLRALGSLFEHAGGSRQLIPLVAVLATCGVVASLRPGRRRVLGVATVALPWLVLPPLVLLGISLIRPVYVERYVIFGQPALALLCAAGLTWLGSLIAGSAWGTRIPARAWPVLGWTVPVLIVAVWAAGLIGPQQAVGGYSAGHQENHRSG